MSRSTGSKPYLSAFAALLMAALGSCSSDDGEGDGNGNGAGAGSVGLGGGAAKGGSGSGASSGTAATSGGRSSVGGASSSGGGARACQGVPFTQADAGESGEACAGVSLEAEPVPLDLYIMMDRSDSMNQLVDGSTLTRWEALNTAVQEFVEKSSSTDLRAGIGFFGRTGGRDDALDCDESYYATPKVAIGPMSEVGTELIAAMANTRPGGLTPTLPALRGALQYAKGWAADNAGRATAVVFVTDGFPTQCQSPVSIQEIANAAKEGRETDPYVRTFVVGLAAGFNLESIAASGGTQKAYLVDEGNVTDSFVETLVNISDSRIACEYDIPEPPDSSMLIDDDKVQVVYTPASGGAEEVPRLESLAACDRNPQGGWYYDNPTNPSRILVCPCTCSRFAAGRVDIRLGCEPYIGLR